MPKYLTKTAALKNAGYTPKTGAPQKYDAELPTIRIEAATAQGLREVAEKQGVKLQDIRREAYKAFLGLTERSDKLICQKHF